MLEPEELRARRQALGYTAQALADELGVSQSAIARWEGGTRPIPAVVAAQLDGLGSYRGATRGPYKCGVCAPRPPRRRRPRPGRRALVGQTGIEDQIERAARAALAAAKRKPKRKPKKKKKKKGPIVRTRTGHHRDWFVDEKGERHDRVCYPVRAHALRAFRAANLDKIEAAGGLPGRPATGGEYDSINERYELRGKRRVKNLAQAIDAALPSGRPFCLDRFDLGTLNETGPGRQLDFRLPDVVAEQAAWESYMRGARAAEDLAAEPPTSRRKKRAAPVDDLSDVPF